jgi:hypothetical protein
MFGVLMTKVRDAVDAKFLKVFGNACANAGNALKVIPAFVRWEIHDVIGSSESVSGQA